MGRLNHSSHICSHSINSVDYISTYGVTFWSKCEHAVGLTPDQNFLHDNGETVDIPRLGPLAP